MILEKVKTMDTPMKYDLFISYCREDQEAVLPLIDLLQERIPTLDIWIDLDEIKLTKESDVLVINAINSSSYFVLVLSKNCKFDGAMKSEKEYAKSMGKKVIPILLPEVKMTNKVLFEFGRVDYIDTNDSRQVEKLLQNLASWTQKELVGQRTTIEQKKTVEDLQFVLEDVDKKKRLLEKLDKADHVFWKVLGIIGELLVLAFTIGLVARLFI